MKPASRPFPGVPLAAVILLFIVSGAAGLIYEVIWLRSLTLIFGKTVHAASAVLAAFMAGLAAGSALGGRLVDRRPGNPLRLYALLELGIGVWALALPFVQKGIGALYVALNGPFDHLSAALSAGRFVTAALALLPATALMGATLPVLSRWAVSHESQVGSRLGLLYALNTLGGVAGCLLAGFVLLEGLGLTGTTLAAALGNFLVAGVAWMLSREAGGSEARETKAPPKGARPSPAAAGPGSLGPARLALVMTSVALGGFGALALEVVWTRALLLVFGSTAYSFSSMLSVFLFGIGAGSLLMTPFADRLKRPWLVLGLLQGGIGVLVLLSMRAVDRLPGVYLSLMASWGLTWSHELLVKFLLSAFLMLGPTLLSGAVWPVAVRIVRPQRARLGSEVGRLYASSTVGSILGSLAGAFVLLPAIGMQASMVALSAAFAVLGAVLALAESTPLRTRATAAGAILVAAAGLAVTTSAWDRKLLTSGAYFMPRLYLDDAGRPVLAERLRETRLVYYAEGVTTTPSVAILGDINKAFFNDGKIEGATALDGMRLQRLLGHLPLLLHSGEPRVALNIGLGSGITVGAMGTHTVDRLDCAEIEPVVVEAARAFDRETFSILSRPGLRLIYNDGRNHLMLTPDRYDAIASAPFAPLVGGAASLYSLEHFRLVKSRLAPGGMTAQFLPLYQLDPVDYLSIMKTFAEVFPEATVWFTGVETVLVGGDGAAHLDVERLARRMAEPRVAESLRQIGLDDPARLLATYCFRVADVKDDLRAAPLNTDDRPRLEFSAPRSHLVNTVKDNLPWLMARIRPVDALLDREDPALIARVAVLREAQRLTMEGRLQVLRGDLEGGVATIERALDLDPTDPYARDLAARNLVKLAERLFARGEREASRRTYERSAQVDPGHFLALYNLARFAFEDGDVPRARALTEQALAQAPHSPSLNYRMGLLLFNEGDAATAQTYLEKAIADDPLYPEPLMVMGDIQRARRQADQAAATYRRAIEIGKQDAEAFTAVAQALVDGGKAQEATVWASRAVEMSPRDPEALFTRARVAAAQNRDEDARRDLEDAVKVGGEPYRERARQDVSLRALLR
ncbi:MAG: fused MFS/spermidine synthase [Candidatus Polarisedimenticolia bacterium]